jgi:hypothetical protein
MERPLLKLIRRLAEGGPGLEEPIYVGDFGIAVLTLLTFMGVSFKTYNALRDLLSTPQEGRTLLNVLRRLSCVL